MFIFTMVFKNWFLKDTKIAFVIIATEASKLKANFHANFPRFKNLIFSYVVMIKGFMLLSDFDRKFH